MTGVQSDGAHEVKLRKVREWAGGIVGQTKLLIDRDHCWYFIYKNSLPLLGM